MYSKVSKPCVVKGFVPIHGSDRLVAKVEVKVIYLPQYVCMYGCSLSHISSHEKYLSVLCIRYVKYLGMYFGKTRWWVAGAAPFSTPSLERRARQGGWGDG